MSQSISDKKRCNSCRHVKPIDEFHLNGGGRFGRAGRCKFCRNRKTKKSRRKDGSLSADQKRALEAYPYGIVQRAKSIVAVKKITSGAKGIPFDLSVLWVAERLASGVCELSGLSLVLSGTFEEGHTHPRAPSIDRISPGGGYTMDNCRIVAWQVNAARNCYSDERLFEMAEALVRARRNGEKSASEASKIVQLRGTKKVQ